MIDTPAARHLVNGIATAMGLGDRVHTAGTTVVPSADRGGSATVVSYAIAAHTVLWCDPVLVDDLATLAADLERAIALDEIQTILAGRGWEHLGRSRMLLLTGTGLIEAASAAGVAPGLVIRAFDANEPADRSMLDTFAGGLSDEDRDEADLSGAKFDDHILGVVNDRGIVALASQQPFDHVAGFRGHCRRNSGDCTRAGTRTLGRLPTVRRDHRARVVPALST